MKDEEHTVDDIDLDELLRSLSVVCRKCNRPVECVESEQRPSWKKLLNGIHLRPGEEKLAAINPLTNSARPLPPKQLALPLGQ